MVEGPCGCCYDDEFDDKIAADHVRDYRKRGAPPATRILAEELARDVAPGQTVLDVGAGVGALHHALLDRGAATAVDVDASKPYLEAARVEAVRRGLGDRVRFEHGDFVEVGGRIEPADLVALDRSACCYPDMHALVGLAAARTRRRLGLVLPRDTALVRFGIHVINMVQWLRRSRFRVYAHPHAEIQRVAEAAGLSRVAQRTAGVWAVLVFERREIL